MAIWELIRYQRTGKVFASLALAVAASGVSLAAMACAVTSQLVHLRLH